MKCPKCDGFFRVIDTRHDEENDILVRERRCDKCGHREKWHDRKAEVLRPIRAEATAKR